MNAHRQSWPFLFFDRNEAGARLGRVLERERGEDSVVVGLARGGVVVAAAVAKLLELPLDALAVRKVGYPGHREYALGAVAPGGVAVVLDSAGLPRERLDAALVEATHAADELDRTLHERREQVSLRGRLVFLVDDGFATGATMLAAVRWARGNGARRVVAAAPIGARHTVELLAQEADRWVCPYVVDDLVAVGIWYADFGAVSADEVLRLLAENAHMGDVPKLAARDQPAAV